ncbi:MAG: hypothetical protein LQ352_003501 [Teloschistes flavicans]|nr:MAG: hypothetical protein LQ352_003501 [Teloschistes flavicans]
MPQFQENLVSRFSSLLKSGKYSDLTIVCRGREFREAQTGKVDLSADSPNALERLLSFLYTANYDDRGRDDAEEITGHGESSINSAANTPSVTSAHNDDPILPPSSALSIPQTGQKRKYVDVEEEEWIAELASRRSNNVLVYALADKYDVKELKNLAKAKFRSLSYGDWDDESVLRVLQMVYGTTPGTDSGLRDEILHVYSRHSDTIMDNPRLVSMLDGDGQLARDIFKTTKEALNMKVTTLTDILDMWTDDSRRQREAHEKEMQTKDDAHRLAIQTKDVASQQVAQVLLSKDREHEAKVEEHRRIVQSKEEGFKNALQAKDKTLETARGWAKEEVRVLKELLLGVLTLGPWALLIVYDLLLWIFRCIYYVIPFIGGRARGKKRPRAPSLSERPSGRRRTFSISGAPFPTEEHLEKEGLRERILDTNIEGNPTNTAERY